MHHHSNNGSLITNVYVMTTLSHQYPLVGNVSAVSGGGKEPVSARFDIETVLSLCEGTSKDSDDKKTKNDKYLIFQEQEHYLEQAALAAYTAWSVNKTHSYPLRLTLKYSLSDNVPLNFSKQSNSSGLGYAIASSLVMAKSRGWMRRKLPQYPIFCTGRVSENGDVSKIDEVEIKVNHIIGYLSRLEQPLKQCLLLLPKENTGDVTNVQRQALKNAAANIEVHYVETVTQALDIILGGDFIANPDGDIRPLGLASINYLNRSLFFGREQQVDELSAIAKNNAVSGIVSTLIGRSGCGKSSMMLSGIVPQLKAASELGLLSHRVVKPSDASSIVALKEQLLSHLLDVNESIEETASSLALKNTEDLLESLSKTEQAQVVWVIDQYEEVFHIDGITHAQRLEFKQWLIAICQAGHAIVLTVLRVEFEAEDTVLTQRENILRLEPPSITDYQAIIERHLNYFDVHFDSDEVRDCFVNIVINEAKDVPLATLSFLLTKLFERDEARRKQLSSKKTLINRTYTLDDYATLGGIKGVITAQAKAAILRAYPVGEHQQPSDVASEHQQLLNPFFSALLAHGSDKAYSSLRHNPIFNNELNLNPPSYLVSVKRLVESFKDVGLLLECGGKEGLKFKLAHDSLLELAAEPQNETSRNVARWPALAHWHYEYQDYLQWFYRVENDFKIWKNHQEVGSLLANSDLLKVAEKLSLDSMIHCRLLREYIKQSIFNNNAIEQKIKEEKQNSLDDANHYYALALNEKANKCYDNKEWSKAVLYALHATEKGKESKPIIGSFNILSRLDIAGHVIDKFTFKGKVLEVSFSSLSNRFAYSSRDRGIYLVFWDTKNTKLLHIHKNTTFSVSISPCGLFVASHSKDEGLIVYDVEGQSNIKVSYDLGSECALAWSGDSKLLITVNCWEVKTWTPNLEVLKSISNPLDGRPLQVIISNDFNNIVWASSMEYEYATWNLKNNSVVKHETHNKHAVSEIFFVGHDDSFVLITGHRQFNIYDFKSGWNKLVEYESVSNACKLSDDTIIFRKGSDQLAILSMLTKEVELLSIDFMHCSPWDNGKKIIAINDEFIYIVNQNVKRNNVYKTQYEIPVDHIVMSGDATLVLYKNESREVICWNSINDHVSTIYQDNNKVEVMCSSSCGRYVAFGMRGEIVVYDLSLNRYEARHKVTGYVKEISFSVCSSKIAVCTNIPTSIAKNIYIFYIGKNESIDFKSFDSGVNSLCFSKCAQFLYIAGKEGTLSLLNIDTQVNCIVGMYKNPVDNLRAAPSRDSLCFSEDNKIHLLADNDGMGTALSFKWENGHLKRIIYSNDGRYIIVNIVRGNSTLIILCAKTMDVLRRFEFDVMLIDIAFTRNDMQLFMSCVGGLVYSWPFKIMLCRKNRWKKHIGYFENLHDMHLDGLDIVNKVNSK